MLSPVSLSTPAFRGVTIKNDTKTLDAIKRIPPAYRENVQEDFETLRANLDAMTHDNLDLTIGLEYNKKPFPYADILSIKVFKKKSPIEETPVLTTSCYVSTGAPAKIPGDVKKGFNEAETSVIKYYDVFKNDLGEEILEELSSFENERVVFGRDDIARQDMTKSLLALSDAGILCDLANLPLFLKRVIDKNPSLDGKKFAIEFTYQKPDEAGKIGGKAEVCLIDMEKYDSDEKDPCVLLVNGEDRIKAAKFEDITPEFVAKSTLLEAFDSMAFYLSI